MEPAKQVDSAVKLSKIILEIQMTAAKLRGEINSVEMVTEKLSSVWITLIQDADDPQLKRLLMESLNRFEDHLEGIPLDPTQEFV
jgi:hypothetical protein